ncbi:MAG: hypothetical protein HC857_08755 [Synechococcales cyanobacterium RU_4_20]|nr:hypothetical protein [Synechococcales cyanobacterium RU_4_20]
MALLEAAQYIGLIDDPGGLSSMNWVDVVDAGAIAAEAKGPAKANSPARRMLSTIARAEYPGWFALNKEDCGNFIGNVLERQWVRTPAYSLPPTLTDSDPILS